MNRPLSTIELPAAALLKLQENGFYYFEDVIASTGINTEARNILRQWNLHTFEKWCGPGSLSAPPSSTNAFDMWQVECRSQEIVTWSKEVDKMLGGGVHLGKITELCGAPGSGKTQMCLQLCVDVQIPTCLGGVGGEAIFIDTASSFTPQRIREIAVACSNHCQFMACKLGQHYEEVKNFTCDFILSRIHLVSVHGVAKLLAAIHLIPNVITQHPNVRLVIVDNLAFPFNCGDSCSMIDRTSYLYRIFGGLQKIAAQKNIAVVVTNQLTTCMNSVAGNSKSELSPALGESMGHRINTRLVLGRHQENFVAVMLKGNVSQDNVSAHFSIRKEGIRD